MGCQIVHSREYDADNLTDAHILLRHICPGDYSFDIDREHRCWKFYDNSNKKLKARYDPKYKSLTIYEKEYRR